MTSQRSRRVRQERGGSFYARNGWHNAEKSIAQGVVFRCILSAVPDKEAHSQTKVGML